MVAVASRTPRTSWVSRWLLRAVGGVLVLGSLGRVSLAAAQEVLPQRVLVVQADAKGLVAMWRFVLHGAQAELLLAAHDFNHDGRLQAVERTSLAVALLSEASSGVTLSWDGTLVRPARVQAKMDGLAPTGSLAAVGLISYALPPGALGPGRHTLRVAVQAGFGGLVVQVHGLGNWSVLGNHGLNLGPLGHQLAQPAQLPAGGHIDVDMERARP